MSLLPTRIEQAIDELPGLGPLGANLKQSLHQAVLAGGKPTRMLADVLHGTWLGHPLHPALTDVTVGGWTLGALFDVVSLLRDDERAAEMADRCLQIGTWSAVPTALTGLADYSGIQQPAEKPATLHALLNDVALVLYVWSLRERRRGERRRAIGIALLAYVLSAGSAWLGGHLTFREQVGVNHNQAFDGPTEWTAVLPAEELEADEPHRADVDGKAVVLYRSNGRVYAMGGVCSHAGAPLENGTFDDCRVTCPWHDSVFDLRDGRVVHGPATHPQPAFDARIADGSVEVRLRRP